MIMKTIKKILVVALLTLGVVSTQAQSTTWGIKAGLNLSSLEGIALAKYVPGFHVGAFGQFMFVDGFGLETGIGYSMLGNKMEYTVAPLNETKISQTNHAHYIQVPVRLLYKFNVGENLYLYPTAGLYLGYGLGGSNDIFDSYERFDLGMSIGLNLQFDQFTVGLGWERGLLKVFQEAKNNAYNSNVMLSVGYLFQ